jgi:type III secretory pathway lipoprotein EscJ
MNNPNIDRRSPAEPDIVAIYTYYEGEYDIETENWYQKIKRIVKSFFENIPIFKVN